MDTNDDTALESLDYEAAAQKVSQLSARLESCLGSEEISAIGKGSNLGTRHQSKNVTGNKS